MKQTYLISYDLKDATDYGHLYEYIKGFGTWAHITESLWAVRTEKSAETIRDEIVNIVENGSSIFVIKSGVESAWIHVKCTNEWLQRNL
jgi:hypothetical protein